MASSSQPGTSSATSQEFSVRIPKARQKKLSMLKFATSLNIDFPKLGENDVKLERENNFREFKTAYNIDSLPKFGAGSEYGKEQKDEARRKKYGIIRKRYNPDNQPWLMKIGNGKQAKKLKGVKEGTVSQNTSYYIFTQCPDGAFEATPVDEWYNFTPVIKYKYLNSDEAEEEFLKRDKIMNYFNVMLKKRIKNDDKETETDETEKVTVGKSKKKGKDFLLTDMDDWEEMSDDDGDDDEDNEEKAEEDEESKGKKKKKKKKGTGDEDGKKKKKNAKNNSDDEAIEESDEGDFDDREVDYMTGSESSLSEAEDKDKCEDKGVDEVKGLRTLLDSAEEDSDEENKPENNEEKPVEKPKEENNGSGSASSDSSSDSESDIEKDETLSSALFMQKKTGSEKKKTEKPASRSATPNSLEKEEKLVPKKRKLEADVMSSKRSRTDSPITTSQGASEGITEDAIRRYLMRKPMTTKDLLSKFKSKKINMSAEQMASTIAQLLKRISPETKYVNDVLYLSLKSPD